MSKQVWVCETCGKLWETQPDAVACEVKHPAASTFTVKAVIYAKSDWRDRTFETWPERICITSETAKAKQFEYCYATYKLDHVGPKGC